MSVSFPSQTYAHFYTMPLRHTPQAEKLDKRGFDFVYLHRQGKTTYHRPDHNVFFLAKRCDVMFITDFHKLI